MQVDPARQPNWILADEPPDDRIVIPEPVIGRFRYYDPLTGRFISKDPIRLMGGLNLHEYASNPVELVDPLGLTAAALRTNMRTAGRPVGPGQTPHHIVQENCKKNKHVEKSRAILARSCVGIDSADNGTRLWGTNPSQSNLPNHPGRDAAIDAGTYHAGAHIHSDSNDKLIYQTLKGVEARGGNVQNALRDIGVRMENGSWKKTFGGCQG